MLLHSYETTSLRPASTVCWSTCAYAYSSTRKKLPLLHPEPRPWVIHSERECRRRRASFPSIHPSYVREVRHQVKCHPRGRNARSSPLLAIESIDDTCNAVTNTLLPIVRTDIHYPQRKHRDQNTTHVRLTFGAFPTSPLHERAGCTFPRTEARFDVAARNCFQTCIRAKLASAAIHPLFLANHHSSRRQKAKISHGPRSQLDRRRSLADTFVEAVKSHVHNTSRDQKWSNTAMMKQKKEKDVIHPLYLYRSLAAY